MKFFIRIVSFIGLFTISQFTYSSSLNHTFATGDTLEAGHLNAAKDAINDNDARITTIEGGSTDIAVDCSANANAFLITTIKDNTTYTLNGMCNGPIEVFRNRNVVIQGVDTNTKTDGILLPTGITVDPFAAIGVYESSIELRNLRLDASNYVSNNYAWGVTSVAVLNTGQQSITRVYDVDFLGGDTGISVFRNGYVKTYDNVTVTGFNLIGIESWGTSHVELNKAIQVIGMPSNSTAEYPETITAGHSSSLQIRNGGTFTPAVGSLVLEPYSISSYDNSSVRVRNSGTTTANGWIGAGQGGSIRINGGAVITGDIQAWDGGKIRVANSSQSGGGIWAGRNSILRFQSVSIDTRSSVTGFSLSSGANLGLRDTTTVLADNPLFLFGFATAYIRDTVNMNSIGVNCSAVGQLGWNNPINLGTVNGCR